MSSSLAPSLSSPACRPEPSRNTLAQIWRDLVLPREHGSWSLAFEPVALGLIAAPSGGGAAFALAVAAGFFARRPLRIAVRERNPVRRMNAWGACLACGLVALAGAALAVAIAGAAWLVWLAPTALLGAMFLSFDLRNAGRDGLAEIAGSAAFGFLPAIFAVIAGEPARMALVLGFMMTARAVPTVLVVRASLRAAKSGETPSRWPVAISAAVLLAGAALYAAGLVSAPWVVLLAVLVVRATYLLIVRQTPLRARTVGIIEAVTGAVFVVVAGVS